jgi:hypothetical protein
MKRLQCGLWLAVTAALCAPLAHAADAAAGKKTAPPAYKNLRFEEDWSKLPEAGTGSAFDPLKHIAVSEKVWLSIGGSTRVRYEYWDDFSFGAGNDDDFLLYRAHLHQDLHLGPHWRFFLDERFGDVNHRDLPGGEREGSDYDHADFMNAFIEAKYPIGPVNLTARLGRFEMEYGKQRVIGPSDWTNNRRLFEGGLLRLQGAKSPWQLDAFVTRPVIFNADRFTWNDADDDTLFSGLYFSDKVGAEKKYTVEAYFLAQLQYDAQLVTQDRYTLGGRALGPVWKNLSFELEAAYQFGHRDYTGPSPLPIATEDISAWMLTGELTYTFARPACAPWLTAGFDYASGDRDRMDRETQTFAPPYPTAHIHLGYVDVVGRGNIIDARLTAGAWPVPKKMKVWADAHWFWRADDDDALYGTSGAVSRAATYVTPGGRTVQSGERFIGFETNLTMNYQFTRYSTWILGCGRFFAGEFLDTTGAQKDIDFVYTSLEFKF